MRKSRVRVNRPLLGLRRSDTEWICRTHGLDPVVDESNADMRFRRNRVRHQVLPLLDEVSGRDVRSVLARQAALLAEEAALLDLLAAGVDVTDARVLDQGSVTPGPTGREGVVAIRRERGGRRTASALSGRGGAGSCGRVRRGQGLRGVRRSPGSPQPGVPERRVARLRDTGRGRSAPWFSTLRVIASEDFDVVTSSYATKGGASCHTRGRDQDR